MFDTLKGIFFQISSQNKVNVMFFCLSGLDSYRVNAVLVLSVKGKSNQPAGPHMQQHSTIWCSLGQPFSLFIFFYSPFDLLHHVNSIRKQRTLRAHSQRLQIFVTLFSNILVTRDSQTHIHSVLALGGVLEILSFMVQLHKDHSSSLRLLKNSLE